MQFISICYRICDHQLIRSCPISLSLSSLRLLQCHLCVVSFVCLLVSSLCLCLALTPFPSLSLSLCSLLSTLFSHHSGHVQCTHNLNDSNTWTFQRLHHRRWVVFPYLLIALVNFRMFFYLLLYILIKKTKVRKSEQLQSDI